MTPATQASHGTTLGLRVHHARRVSGLTLRQVAQEAGCSESLLSKIEHGHTQPSLGMLKRIATALGSSVALLTDDSAEQPSPVLRASQHTRRTLPQHSGHVTIEPLLPQDKGALIQGEIRHLAPQMISAPQQHIGQVLLYVLQGEMEVILADVQYRLYANDSMSFDTQQPYRYQNPTSQPSQVLWVISPAMT